jgi:hypothetical protein
MVVAKTSPDGIWINVDEAVRIAGCSEAYIRRLLGDGRLKGWKLGQRAWMADRSSVLELASQLTTRSNRRKAERKSLKKPAKRRRKG